MTGADLLHCTRQLIATNGIGQSHTQTWSDASSTATLSWDGRDDEGVWFDPGTVGWRGRVDCGPDSLFEETSTSHIVRLGITTIVLMDPPDGSGKVGLAYHKDSLFSTTVTEIGDVPEYVRGASVGATILL